MMQTFIEILQKHFRENVKTVHNGHYKLTFDPTITNSGRHEVIVMSSSPSDRYAVKQAFRDCRRKIQPGFFDAKLFSGTEFSGLFNSNK